jgi:hypothetical protein
VAEDSWNAHIRCLEDEVKKIYERADKLEPTIPDLENEQKKHALRDSSNIYEMLQANTASISRS